MTPQQKNLILDALRIGEVAVIDDWELGAFTPQKEVMLWKPVEQIRAAIKELEAMPTETQLNGETK